MAQTYNRSTAQTYTSETILYFNFQSDIETAVIAKAYHRTTSISQKRHTLTIVSRPYLKSATL